MLSGGPDVTLPALEAPLTLDALSAGSTRRACLTLSSGLPGCPGVALRTSLTGRTDGTGRTGLTLSSGLALDALDALGPLSASHARIALDTTDTSDTRDALDALSALRARGALRAAQSLGVRLEADVQVEVRLAFLAVLAETDEPERAVAVVATADRADRAADTDARRRPPHLAASRCGSRRQTRERTERERHGHLLTGQWVPLTRMLPMEWKEIHRLFYL